MSADTVNSEASIETKSKSAEKALTWVALCIGLVGIAGAVYFGVTSTKKINALNAEVSKVNTDNATLKAQVADHEKWLGFQAFMHNIQGAEVTDDLVVNRIILQYQTGSLKGLIDVGNQPSALKKYKGEGKYDMSDRELKAMLLALVDRVAADYKSNFQNQIVPSWDTAEIQLTVLNYELGTYSKGQIKLKGE